MDQAYKNNTLFMLMSYKHDICCPHYRKTKVILLLRILDNVIFSCHKFDFFIYSKTYVDVKRPLSKRPKRGFQDQLSLNGGKKYYRMFQ